MNILHILRNSLPNTCGGSIRSGYICKYQKEFANIFVFTTFLFKSDKSMEIINGIPHFRVNKNLSSLLRFYLKLYIRTRKVIFRIFSIDISSRILEFPLSFFTKSYIKKIIKAYKIDLIHQYTQSFIGYYCLEVANKLNIPFVYSFRGFLEEGMLATANERRFSNKKTIKFSYKKLKNEEIDILKKSDFVTTLSEPMMEVLIERGINKKKIIVIPNSIEGTILAYKKDHNLEERLSLDGYFVIGHFGHVRWYEGIEILLKALELMINVYNKKIKLLIIGEVDTKYLNYLKNIIEIENLKDNVLFLETVPHNEIGNYYSITDVIVIPRLNTYECRMVTSMKPVDAMGFKTLVIASDLPALRYTITPYITGLLFEPGNSNDLAFKILECFDNPNMCYGLVNHAYNNVLRNFTWDSVVPRYEEVYKKLIET